MKKIKLVIIITISFVLGVMLGIKYKEYDMLYGYDPEEHWAELEREIKKNYADGDELPYYKKTKDEVMKMLPKPDIDVVGKMTKDDSTFQNDMWLHHYWEELLSSEDSVKWLNKVIWNNMPDKDKPTLLIFFEKKDSIWIVSKCIQWHPDKVYLN